MKRTLAGVAFALTAIAIACGHADVVVGDDTNTSPTKPTDSNPMPDGSAGDANKPPLASNDAGGDSTAPVDAKADVSCPMLPPPPPGFCDGSLPVAKYDPGTGCVIGYACGKIDCSVGGGGCVGLASGTCPSNHYGDPAKYDCGGGLGVTCCLP